MRLDCNVLEFRFVSLAEGCNVLCIGNEEEEKYKYERKGEILI